MFNINNRKDLVITVPFNQRESFNVALESVEAEHEGFKAPERQFNPDRVRLMDAVEHYEFYLERTN